MAQFKSEFKLLPNTLYHVSDNTIQSGIDTLQEFSNTSRKWGEILTGPFTYPH